MYHAQSWDSTSRYVTSHSAPVSLMPSRISSTLLRGFLSNALLAVMCRLLQILQPIQIAKPCVLQYIR